MESTSTLRWGVMGCGRIANDFVIALNYCSSPHKIVAVAEAKNLSHAVSFRDRLELPDSVKTYDCYDQLIQHPDLDIIYIATLNHDHYEWALKVLRAGKPVLCEKPLGVNIKQVCNMVEAARSAKVFFMEGFWSRFFPAWRYIQDVIDSGKYGAMRYCGANFGILAAPDRLDISTCETPFMDVGVYTIMFAMFVNQKCDGQPKIHASSRVDANGSDVWANITLDFGNNVHALCSYNGAACGTNSAFVSFERGQIQIPEFFWAPTRLIEMETPARAGVTCPTVMEFPLNEREDDIPRFSYNNATGMRYEADHVYECISHGKLESDIMSLDESIRLHETITRVRREIGVVFAQDNVE